MAWMLLVCGLPRCAQIDSTAGGTTADTHTTASSEIAYEDYI